MKGIKSLPQWALDALLEAALASLPDRVEAVIREALRRAICNRPKVDASASALPSGEDGGG